LKTQKNKWFKEGEVLANPENLLDPQYLYATGFVMMGETLTISNIEKLYNIYDNIKVIQYDN